MSRYVNCAKCGKKCQASVSGTCKECRTKSYRESERHCIYCNAKIDFRSPRGELKAPTIYARQLFCSNSCSRRYVIANPGQKPTEALLPAVQTNNISKIEGSKYSGRASFSTETEAMEFIKGLYRKGYEFMGDPNKEPKFSHNTGFYGVEYMRDYISGKMHQSFFITTRPNVYKYYIRRSNV